MSGHSPDPADPSPDAGDPGGAPRPATGDTAPAAAPPADGSPGEDRRGRGGLEGHTRSAEIAAARPEEPVAADGDPTVKLTAAGEPRPQGGRGAWLALKRTVVRAWDDNIFSEAASAAFWQTLSLPPLLLGLLGSLGYIGSWFGPNTTTVVQEQIVRAAGNVFSRNAVDEIIAPTVQTILTTGRSELVSLGFVISLWSGSSAMSSFVDAITRAHSQYGIRNPVWQRILALLMYVVGLVAGIIALPILALGPDLLPDLLPQAVRANAVTVIGLFYYPGLGLLLMLGLTTLYRLALPAKPPWYRGLPGALLAAVVFLVGVTGLRVYISWLTTTGYTYGALAAPIAFLLAAFFIGLAIVLGAHFNAAIQHYWPKRLKDRRCKVEQRGVSEAGVTEASVTEASVTEGGVTEGGVTEGGVTEGGVTTS